MARTKQKSGWLPDAAAAEIGRVAVGTFDALCAQDDLDAANGCVVMIYSDGTWLVLPVEDANSDVAGAMFLYDVRDNLIAGELEGRVFQEFAMSAAAYETLMKSAIVAAYLQIGSKIGSKLDATWMGRKLRVPNVF